MPVHDLDLSVRTLDVHGHRRAYVDVGTGPVVLLLHGIGSNCETWQSVIPGLVAAGYRVLAPDFLGHGQSAKPRADYSLGGFANGMRDLLTILGIETVTVVGHSLGGGVAMQFAYQFPDRTERVVLVDAGGLGPDVHPVLRALTLPGASLALALAAHTRVHKVGRAAAMVAHRSRLPRTIDFAEMTTVYDGLIDLDSRQAFLHVLRGAVDWRGQVVTMLDRCYLAEGMPVCVIWGGRDTLIPVAHAAVAAQAMPGSRLVIFDRAGHFPHRDDPERFVDVVTDFIESTDPSEHLRGHWREILKRRYSTG